MTNFIPIKFHGQKGDFYVSSQKALPIWKDEIRRRSMLL